MAQFDTLAALAVAKAGNRAAPTPFDLHAVEPGTYDVEVTVRVKGLVTVGHDGTVVSNAGHTVVSGGSFPVRG
jgi:hypothetical protein